MAKFQSPLLGYNNNVRHRGRTFHIQTEDSGVNHPHIITHVFMDGGRILKSVKKSYAEHLGSEGMSETVRALMKEQHKAMFIALRDGQFDELVEGKRPATAAAPGSEPRPEAKAAPAQPEAKAAPAAPAPPPTEPSAAEPVAPSAPTSTDPHAIRASESTEVAVNDLAVIPMTTVSGDYPLPAEIIPPKPAPSPAARPAGNAAAAQAIPAKRLVDDGGPATIDERRGATFGTPLSPDTSLPPEIEALLREDTPRPSVSASRERRPPEADAAPNTTREQEKRRPTAQELTLDFDALEHDSHAEVSPIYRQADLPPPPTNLFTREPRTGAYSTVEASPLDPPTQASPSRPQAPIRPPAAAARLASTPSRSPLPAPAPAPAPKAEGDARYAPARPAAIFGAATKPHQPAPSIFSDDLVSDKSLDEVILSYLAEDLDSPRRK